MDFKKIIIFLILMITITNFVFADVNLTANGNDWFRYSPQEKYELMGKICVIYKIDSDKKSIDRHVIALAILYSSMYEYSDGNKDSLYWQEVMTMPVIKIVGDMILNVRQ